MRFSTKAETLAVLQEHGFSVLPQVCLTVRELYSKLDLSAKVAHLTSPYIVRSSALSEDTVFESNAGAFLSVPNVSDSELINACYNVAQSFNDGNEDNQILIQPMLQDIAICGVVFTVDPNTGGNYFVVNYDNSGSSDSVTSGLGENLKTYYLFHGKQCNSEMINRVISVATEIMQLFDNNAIDIEFAITHSGELYILQVRPLVLRVDIANQQSQLELLDSARNYLMREFKPQLYVKGKRTIYSVMADWNPAEMIGVRPKPLALSLYKRLITDGVWTFQRDNYGYKNMRSFPLLRCLCGVPYIDTRASFNSFIPKTINDDLTQKLADYYLDRLAENPTNHDKVEFEIIFSCYTFDISERIKILKDYNFTELEISTITDALRDLTNNVIDVNDGLWLTDMKKIEYLKQRQSEVLESKSDCLTKIYWLLEDCSRYGTLPFAGLARAGFIAVQLLQSLMSTRILTENDYYNFMSELNTVGSQMIADRNELSKLAFLKKYGHLRPGTYDITSARYDAAPEHYFGNAKIAEPAEKHNSPLTLTIAQYQAIHDLMVSNGLSGDVLDLFKFIKMGIEGREWSKFVFTKSISDALELIANLCESYGISRDDAAYLNIEVVDTLFSQSQDIEALLQSSIAEGKRSHVDTLKIVLPPIIQNAEEIFAFEMPSVVENYITQKSVVGETLSEIGDQAELCGKILLISAADPGFDWIFSHKVAGFITAYGGVNSHMAIRAGELSIPAVIGVGEQNFNRYKQAKTIRIDCANKRIEVIC